MTTSTQSKGLASRSSAFAVSAGILLSQLIGLVRERVFAHYFGNSDAADAFRAAFRIPNFLQNLFGEGVLSASFIPVYARLRAEERHEEATRLAESIFAILFLITSLLTLVGVFATPLLIDVIAPGLSRRKAPTHHPAGADPLSGSGAAGYFGMVPRHPEQPPEVLPFLRCTGDLERCP